ncbi:Low-molecular weight cobalt-containing nitrile hydratase subunit beta [Thalassovita autumnalis]|uniref:Nitrile hydratase subunit beta n=1 Tax=Thalassovita autumnalis TaxID=2072972 RepID=A0A0P1FPW5_9RHOB|nr:nitrile hydratase subunit beta [Thalassovita autumnalis]CUH62620.1 Low-molecular weight cobalt-containing nitrile hydratase subunit beta [Thalassovita autumnalis]CUH70358.1 Low-molecular weight cobalt-containing nitrile hydratase subunit beta [Thalassovita autumnalis]
MSRVHDMGGRFGDGAVLPEPQDGPVFATEWHARALAVTLACGSLGQWNIDTSRHARERLSPKDYSRFSYYEKWISALADLLVETGVLTLEDLEQAAERAKDQAGGSEEIQKSHPLSSRRLLPEQVAAVLAKGGPADRQEGPVARFQPGQKVRTRRLSDSALVNGGHTRLPNYAAGAVGHIERYHGNHVLPDSAAHGLGEAPEPLYAVRFAASELWAHPEHPGDQVVLDLWQSYLLPEEVA